MRFILKSLILLSFLTVLGSSSAQADGKRELAFSWPIIDWTKSHKRYRSMKAYHPYLENSRHSQHLQYKDVDWYVEDWTSQEGGREGGMALINKFYKADIFKDQIVDKTGKSLLVVGPNFYRLSGLDKRRAVTLVDSVYGVTQNNENGSFIVTDWHTKKPIGVYDNQGLRLQ